MVWRLLGLAWAVVIAGGEADGEGVPGEALDAGPDSTARVAAMRERLRKQGEEQREERLRKQRQEGLEVARVLVRCDRRFWRGMLLDFEVQAELGDRLAKAQEDMVAAYNELHHLDPDSAGKLRTAFAEYALRCSNARNRLGSTKVAQVAASPHARTGPGDVAKAEAELAAARQAWPEGKGEAHEAYRRCHQLMHQLHDQRDEAGERRQLVLNERAMVRNAWFSLPAASRQVAQVEHSRWEAELERLLDEAKDAWSGGRSDTAGTPGWPAARERFVRCLERRLSFEGDDPPRRKEESSGKMPAGDASSIEPEEVGGP